MHFYNIYSFNRFTYCPHKFKIPQRFLEAFVIFMYLLELRIYFVLNIYKYIYIFIYMHVYIHIYVNI